MFLDCTYILINSCVGLKRPAGFNWPISFQEGKPLVTPVLASFPHSHLVLSYICYTLSFGLDLVEILSCYYSLPTALLIQARLLPAAELCFHPLLHSHLLLPYLPAMKSLFLFLAILLVMELVASGNLGLSSVWDAGHELLCFPLTVGSS